MLAKKYSFFFYLLPIMLILFISTGCSDDSSQSTSPTNPDKVIGVPSDPGPGNLAGIIVGTIQGQPLAGVTVSANSRSTTTASDGTFLLSGVGEGTFRSHRFRECFVCPNGRCEYCQWTFCEYRCD